MAEREMCNICGVPVSKIEDNVCQDCPGDGTYCTMEPDMIIEKRVYDYAAKHRLLQFGHPMTFSARYVRECFEMPDTSRKAPKYMREAVSCDGMSFPDVASFPQGRVLRVCRGGSSGFLIVGDLVYRRDDTLRVVQGERILDAKAGSEALAGANFEESYFPIPS